MGKQVGFQLDPKQAPSHVQDNMESGRTRDTTPSKTKGGRKGKRENARRTLLMVTFVGAMLVAAYASFAGHTAFSVHSLNMRGMHGMRRFGDGSAETLVIYVYAHTDVEYSNNLRFFLEHGVAPRDPCDYLVVVQEGRGVLSTDLPPLPDNVLAVRHPNECFDWGTFGWAIENKVADTSRYRYVIFLNSSVRGPFLPAYWPPEMHWSRILTSRISDGVKLVGATISCEGANKGGVLTGEMRRNPHVQSYVVATDQTGLGLLQGDHNVLKCYSDIHDAIWHAEVGSSAAILNAGYNIDALMLRYQGVDWREKETWGCNAGINPYAEFMYDGVNISPFEVMFVKVKEFLLEANWTTAASAKKYTQWMQEEGETSRIHENEYNAKKTELRNMKVLNMRARGSACFDFPFYRSKNPDLPVWGPETMWEHFVTSGQHEGRVFRFRCKPGAVEFPKPVAPPKKEAKAKHTAGTAIGKGQAVVAGAVAAHTDHVIAGDVISTKQAAAAQKAAAAAAAGAQQGVQHDTAGAAGATAGAATGAATQGGAQQAETAGAGGATTGVGTGSAAAGAVTTGGVAADAVGAGGAASGTAAAGSANTASAAVDADATAVGTGGAAAAENGTAASHTQAAGTQAASASGQAAGAAQQTAAGAVDVMAQQDAAAAAAAGTEQVAAGGAAQAAAGAVEGVVQGNAGAVQQGTVTAQQVAGAAGTTAAGSAAAAQQQEVAGATQQQQQTAGVATAGQKAGTGIAQQAAAAITAGAGAAGAVQQAAATGTMQQAAATDAAAGTVQHAVAAGAAAGTRQQAADAGAGTSQQQDTVAGQQLAQAQRQAAGARRR